VSPKSRGDRTHLALPFEYQGIPAHPAAFLGGGVTLWGGGAENCCENVEESGQVDEELGGSPIYLPHLAPQSLRQPQAQPVFFWGGGPPYLIYAHLASQCFPHSLPQLQAHPFFFFWGPPIYLAHLAPLFLPHSFPQLQEQPVFFVPQLQADFVHSSHSIAQFPLPEGLRYQYLYFALVKQVHVSVFVVLMY
jgi:hypothetical protein